LDEISARKNPVTDVTETLKTGTSSKGTPATDPNQVLVDGINTTPTKKNDIVVAQDFKTSSLVVTLDMAAVTYVNGERLQATLKALGQEKDLLADTGDLTLNFEAVKDVDVDGGAALTKGCDAYLTAAKEGSSVSSDEAAVPPTVKLMNASPKVLQKLNLYAGGKSALRKAL
jgi:hypothetical protein